MVRATKTLVFTGMGEENQCLWKRSGWVALTAGSHLYQVTFAEKVKVVMLLWVFDMKIA